MRNNHKERVLDAINHKITDRVPIDYWATEEITSKLVTHFSLTGKEELLKMLDIDLRYVFPRYIGPELSSFPDGSSVDIWGVKRKRQKIRNIIYNEVCYSPLAHVSDPDALEDVKWPNPDWYDYSEIKILCDKYDKYAIVTVDERTNRTTVLHEAIYLCGIEKVMMDLALNPAFINKLFSKITEFYLEINKRILATATGAIDILLIGDDLGTQNGLLISPEMIKKLLMPYLKKYVDLCKQYNVKVMLHSCGAIRSIIPDLIKLGIDILNPIQVKARGMIPKELKKEFGEELCFHGAIDTQEVLPFGSPKDIKKEVKDCIKILCQNGGYIMAPTHNIQVDVPIDNIIVMYEAAKSIRI